MAIRRTFTDPATGEVSPNAHHVLRPPHFDEATQTLNLRVDVYASKADYDAKKKPVIVHRRAFGPTEYAGLMTAIKNAVEPELINRFFPGGVRVAD